LKNVYWGPEYSDREIYEKIAQKGIDSYYYKHNIEDKIGKFLYKGFIIGRFNGRMEYGPRALGNRSILSSPVKPSLKKHLNRRLKRTFFMPFGASILYEYACENYEGISKVLYPSEFMTITCIAKKTLAHKTRAVCHVDNTSRPHVVRKGVNSSYYKIIEAYKKYSGLPLILNTSFNTHEEPIICSPEEAIRSFLNGAVDILCIGNFALFSSESKKILKKEIQNR
jgi:carbamoyltransferase